MIVIKKLILLIMVCMLCGCSNIENQTHKYVNDENYIQLVYLINLGQLNENELKYKLNSKDISEIKSQKYLNQYSINFANEFQQYTHSINTNTIEVKDILTNQTTTFKDNVNITSLDHFSTIVLDSYKEEFSYYSMKDFIPLALTLIEDENLDFYHELEKYQENNYRLTGTVKELKLDDKLHNIFLETSDDYKELYNKENNKVTIVFRTNEDNSYFLSSFVFKINDITICKIS